MAPLSTYERWLAEIWHEVGTVGSGGMGITAISWEEIKAWAELFFKEEYIEWVKSPTNRWMPVVMTHTTLSDWELQTIRFLSSEYCSEASENAPNRPCPKEIILEDISKDEAYAESMRLKESLLEMFGKKE